MVDGDPNAPLLIVGMAPGREELANDKPFIGGSGRLLWKQLLKKGGISRADCYIINTIGELPEGANGEPTKEQLDRYWDQFDEAIARSSARTALLLGGTALTRVTGLRGIEDWRGYLVPRSEARSLLRTSVRETVYKTSNKKTGRKAGDPKTEHIKLVVPPPWPATVTWCIPCLHPAAILRTGYGWLPAFASDAGRAGRAVQDRLVIEEPVWHDGVPMWPSFRDTLFEGPCIVDIETPDAQNTDVIVRIGATLGGTVWTALWDDHARDVLRQCLMIGSPAAAFNISFDAPRLAKHGVVVPEPWWDIMLAAGVCEPDLKKSLNFTIPLYTDSIRHKHWSENEPAKYNAWDVWQERRLYYILREHLAKTGQLELFEKRMMPTLPVLVAMTERGIQTDADVRREWVNLLVARQRDTMERWEAIAPGKKTSGKNLNSYLYGELGLPVQYHKHGGVTAEVSAIQKMLMYETLSPLQRETLTTLLELRRIEKDLKTYAEVETDYLERVHPGFLPAGKDEDEFGKGIAGTGRITANGPNIQNQPQSARRMYVPSEPGYVLLEADFSQIEARIIAQLSGDTVLAGAIAEGLHQSNMRVLGVDKTRAKNGFYGWAYGAGKRTLHNTFVGRGYNVAEADCEALLRGFDRRFSKAASWRRRIAAEVSTRYYLANAFGRRRYFMGGSRDTPKGLDFHPQSCAADIGWTVLRQLDDALRETGARILAWVHDSVLLEAPVARVPAVCATLRAVMQQAWPQLGGLVVPIEIKQGTNWGEMEELHE